MLLPLGNAQDPTRQNDGHSDCPLLAETVLVSQSPSHINPSTNSCPHLPQSSDTVQQRDQTSQSTGTPSQCVVFGWTSALEQMCSLAIQDILSSSRKDSTGQCNGSKWRCFLSWTQQKGVLPETAGIFLILDYILFLKSLGLALSSLKSYEWIWHKKEPSKSGDLFPGLLWPSTSDSSFSRACVLYYYYYYLIFILHYWLEASQLGLNQC